jgi:GntR family transcriptional repressor for pyruvate dehydrogenase complex
VAQDQHLPRKLADLFASDPVTASLAEIIRDLQLGDRLPSERDLAIELNVSRTALRDRLGILEGLGVLRRRTGSGTFVETLKPDALALALNLAIASSQLPLNALHSVRIALERQAAYEAAVHADPVLVAYMRRAVDTMGNTTVRSDVLEADRAFHQSLLRAAGNPALTFFADALADVLGRDVALRSSQLDRATLSSSAQALMVHHHQQIHEAVLSGDKDRAMRTIDAHFDALPSS